LSPL
jgi:hypothetical protein